MSQTELPPARYPNGELVLGQGILPYMVAKAVILYKEDCEEAGARPDERLVRHLEAYRFDKLSYDDWWSIADAMMGCCEDDLTERFHRYAEEQYFMLHNCAKLRGKR